MGVQAIIYAGLLLIGTGLIPHWGVWYSKRCYHRMQAQALLRGELAISRDPSALAADLCWSEQGVHQVWGLGVALWRIPFDLTAKLFGHWAFPDRFVLGAILSLTAFVVLSTLLYPIQHEPGLSWLKNLGTVSILLMFPAFMKLLTLNESIYIEAIAYEYCCACLLVCGLVSLTRRPRRRQFWLLCGLAGVAGMIRPTLQFYSISTVILALAVMISDFKRQKGTVTAISTSDFSLHRDLSIGAGLFCVGGFVLWWTNVVRFGSGFEFGHRLNVQGTDLAGSMYATRFDHPFLQESWWRAMKELFGALFLIQRHNNTEYYAQHIFFGQSEMLRWRFISFDTFDLSCLALVVAGWATAIAFLGQRVLGRRFGADQSRIPAVLALWSLLSCLPIAVFYLHTPVIASRYMMDFAAAFAASTAAAWINLFEVCDTSKPGNRAVHIVMLVALFFWLGVEYAKNPHSRQLSVKLEELPELAIVAKNRPNLPPSYKLGEVLTAFGIPYNGTGWDSETGRVKPCVTFFLENPRFVELDMISRGQVDPRDIRVKIGLESLKLESLAPRSNAWRIRFSGPTHSRYQVGIQPMFIATVANDRLGDHDTPWILESIRWRE
jgi:hypothetical protein